MIDHPWRLAGLFGLWLLFLAAIVWAAVVLPTMPADWRVF